MGFKSLKSIIAVSIITILSLFMILMILYLKNKLEYELYVSIENNALNLVKATENNVDSVYHDIQFYKKSIIKRKKEELKNYTAIAYSIISTSYDNYKLGKLSEKEAKESVKNHLKKLRYSDGIGYFWINDTTRPLPKMVMHPTVPSLNGKILDDKKFYCTLDKENLFKVSVDIALEHSTGFVEYLWPKPVNGKLTKEQSKISYVKFFKPWNWVLGSGIYLDDIEKEVNNRLDSIAKNLNEIILKQKIGKNGYFFIFDENNKIIVHPSYLDTKIIDKSRGSYIKLLNRIKKAAHSKTKSIEYEWDRLDDIGNFKYKKKVFITYFEPLKWYIASSIYLDDYQSHVLELNKKLVIIGIFFILIGFIISIWISQRLTKPIFNLINSFNVTDKNGIPLEIPLEDSLLEIEILTNDFNKMIKSINESRAKKDELELQLNQSRKMDAIGQLAGGIAHDFNNMLAGIINATQLLKSINEDFDDKSKELIDMISLASERATALISKLLSFSHKGKLISTAIDIHSIIDDTISILNKTIDRKVTIISSQNASNSMVVGDDSQLQNAFMNIAINASHAMADGGELLFETNSFNFDDDYCKNSQFDISNGEYIEIKISDTGSGIDEDILCKIFEPFFTTKEQGKGTGLGLAAVYGSIKTHKGEIKVQSELGVGTSFFIYLPCTERKKEIIKEEVLVTSEARKELILLVDDEEVIRVTGKYILEKMGYRVLIAEDGLEAIKIYKEKTKEIDLVIMDMIMPNMNGTEAFSEIRKVNNKCCVIISSGFTKDENLIELKEAGLAGFLAKPFRINELKSVLRKVFSDSENS